MLSSIIKIAPFFIYIGILIVCLLSIIGKVRYGLALLVFLLPLQNVIERLHQFPLGKDLNDALIISALLGWLIYSFYNKSRFFEPTRFNKLFLIMIIYTYFSLWFGSSYLGIPMPFNPADERLQAWKNYIIFPILYFIVVNNIKNIKQIKRIILIMALSMFIMDYYTLDQIRWMPGILSREKIAGTFVWGGVNPVAAFYAQYTLILIGIFIIYKKKIIRWVAGILSFIGIYITLFLFSRGAYLALLLGLIVISFFKKKILLIPLILLLMFWQNILPPEVVERMNQTQDEYGTLEPSAETRIELWKKSIEIFKENPLLGVGFYVFPFLNVLGGFTDPHNIYLRILVEQGIVGLIILLIIFLLALKSGWELYRKTKDNFLKALALGFLACLVSTMVTNFFGDRWTYLQLGSYFWTLLALVERGNLITVNELASSRVNRVKKGRIINKKHG